MGRTLTLGYDGAGWPGLVGSGTGVTVRSIRAGTRLAAGLVVVLAASTVSGPSAASPPSVGETETVSENERDGRTGDSVTASIAVSWSGRVTAVWYRPAPEESSLQGRLMGSTRSRNGTWSDPDRISRRIRNPLDLSLSAGRAGQASAAWTVTVRPGRRVVFEAHLDDGEWSTPERLGRGRNPQVVQDGQGVTHVMWVNKRATIASRSADGAWTRRRFVHGGQPENFDLTTNHAGDAFAMWDEPGCVCASTASRPRGSQRWSRRELSGAHFLDFAPGLGAFPSGRILAAWIYVERLSWAQRTATGRWSPVRDFGEPNGIIEQSGSMAIAVARRRQALALWSAEVGGHFASRYRPGHGFGTPVRLSEQGAWFDARGGTVVPDGAALVAGATRRGQIGYRWQRGPRREWRPLRLLDSVGEVTSVASSGRRTAVMYLNDGLRVRVIDLVPRT